MPRRVVIATANKGKLSEIQRILGAGDYRIASQAEFDVESVDETGDTFLANALLKARHAANETGLIAIADDSGLSVDALNGDPGVRSARYAGDNASDQQNIDKLLQSLQAVDQQQRGASFHCAAVVVFPEENMEPLVASGEWRGCIAGAKSGDGGFGYDPVFFDPRFGKCAAQMTAEEKNGCSHRGQAFRRIGALLEAALAQ